MERYFDCIQSIEAGSSKITTWCLSILGGSVLAIISDSYIHPNTPSLKTVYLTFVAGWGLIGVSIFNGKEIMGSAMASRLYKNRFDLLAEIFTDCNKYYRRQILFFNLGLLVFGIWLLLYLCWWIFWGPSTAK